MLVALEHLVQHANQRRLLRVRTGGKTLTTTAAILGARPSGSAAGAGTAAAAAAAAVKAAGFAAAGATYAAKYGGLEPQLELELELELELISIVTASYVVMEYGYG